MTIIGVVTRPARWGRLDPDNRYNRNDRSNQYNRHNRYNPYNWRAQFPNSKSVPRSASASASKRLERYPSLSSPMGRTHPRCCCRDRPPMPLGFPSFALTHEVRTGRARTPPSAGLAPAYARTRTPATATHKLQVPTIATTRTTRTTVPDPDKY